jgi:hypothetical protein
MLKIFFAPGGIPQKIELVPGSQMKIAAELHDLFCTKQSHTLCQLSTWMQPARKVIEVVLE